MAVRELPKYESKYPHYIYVNNVDKFVEKVLQSPPKRIAVDTETYYNPLLVAPKVITKWVRDTPNNVPFGVSLYWEDKGYWIDKELHKLKPLLENPDIEKILHNSKYDIFMFKNIGIELKGKIWDTMIMIHLIDEEFECNMPSGKKKKSKRLKDLAYHFLGDDAHELEDLVSEYRRIMASNRGLKKSEISYKDVNDANPVLMKDYAVADTEFTYKLYDIFMPMLAEQRLFEAYDVDMNATWAVIDIERQGYRVDLEIMKSDEEKLNTVIQRRLDKIYDIVGKKINVNSDRELVQAFEGLGVKWRWFTEKDEYQTDKSVLKSIINDDYYQEIIEVAEAVLDYRKASKILSTYIEGIYPYVQADGKVHPDFWISPNDFGSGSTKTGRLSSSNPNFQNIPKKPIKLDDFVIKPRDYFIADDGYILVLMDYDQEEYRLLGHYGNDQEFKKIIFSGQDIHKGTASLLYGVPYEEVDDDLRSKGKTNNFGLVYGLGNANFANVLGHNIDTNIYRTATQYLYKKYKPWDIIQYYEPIQYIKTLDEVLEVMPKEDKQNKELVDAIKYFFSDEVKEGIIDAIKTKRQYFNQFPGIKKFLDDCKDVAKRRGWVKTWVGRRRHFKDPKREAYKAPNAVIQGGCGDIMKVKLHEINQFLKSYKSCIVNTVHDEIAYMIHKSELHLIPKIKEIQESLPFKVPITCGLEWHEKRWGSKQEATYEEIKKEVV